MATDETFNEDYDDIELVGDKPLTWFDVSAMGTGEMLFTAGWAWIVFIASFYGVKWTLIGFVAGAVVVFIAWWLYREMVTAVPEPGSIQSYGREAGLFSLGTSYFILYAPVYAGFMWLELLVAQGLFTLLFPDVPTDIWPYVVLLPVVALNLLGHQITGKVQAALVVVTLVGDIVLAIGLWWLVADSDAWSANWESPTPIDWIAFFTIAGLWLGIMAGILEVQQVLVDEWRDFRQSRDVGLLTAPLQLWARQIPLALAVLAGAPLSVLIAMPVPTVEVVDLKLQQSGHHPLFYLALFTMLIATYTTLSVFFMGMGRIVALYSQQGALPRILGRYSSRSVPWVAIVLLAALALIGVYWQNFNFVLHVLSSWSATLYLVIGIFFLRMRARSDLDRPLKVRFGVPLAWFLVVYTALIAYGIFKLDNKAFLTWVAVVAIVALYDRFVVPRTTRGKFYREQVTRRRTSAVRL
ncbi:APC family permease [Nocardioides aquiterrae]|uniref:APC family permease n=1 Tax=Nocardioides aquiterrae TaxID=203799 RepID=A0ABP4F0S8_9ACTN